LLRRTEPFPLATLCPPLPRWYAP